jgi:hypothetical protein
MKTEHFGEGFNAWKQVMEQVHHTTWKRVSQQVEDSVWVLVWREVRTHALEQVREPSE